MCPKPCFYAYIGTVENLHACYNSIHPSIIEAGKHSKITPQLIYNTTIHPWCHNYDYAVHSDSISLNIGHNDETGRLIALGVLYKALPHIVRHSPQSFPFMYPQPATAITHTTTTSSSSTSRSGGSRGSGSTTGLFTACADPLWIRECKDMRRRGNKGEFREVDHWLPDATVIAGLL